MSTVSQKTADPSSSSGGWAGFFLTLLVAGCIALIGLSGYVKYELDRTESRLASPETALTPEQQAYDKMRRDLGYSGFLGHAQDYARTHDASVIPDIKASLKQAGESLDHLPEHTAAETRHDLQAILSTFDEAGKKAEKSAAAPTPDFGTDDLAPLYAALPVLDARVDSALAADRLDILSAAQFWSTAETLLAWAGLIAAAGLAAGLFIAMRGKNSAPMRALAQSVKNMASGDMRTTIWGMERQDSVGELARAIDLARFHFSQLPDMSLLSEQGPVRIRFEGNTRSLFEAMMRVISRDSEQVHAQAATLTEAVQKQQETLAHVIQRVEAVLVNVEKRAVSGDVQVRQALHGMLGSAESLKHAQEHAADQLNRLIPFLQERTTGLSEITQITGKQVAQALQSLALTERGLKASAEQSEEAIRKFSSTADTLGERLFGAVNLLQASGKVLAETTETARSRFDAAVERISSAALPSNEPLIDPQVAAKLEQAATALESAHGRLETLLADQEKTTRANIDLLTTQSNGLLTQTSATSQTLSTAADRLRDEQQRLGEMIDKLAPIARDAATPATQPAEASQNIEAIREGFGSLERRVSELHAQIALVLQQQTQPVEEKPMVVDEQMQDHWFQMAAQIEATRSNLAQVIMQQTDRVEAHIASLSGKSAGAATERDFVRDAQNQMEQQTMILNELVATLGLLDAHMQELRSQVTKRAG